MTKPLQTYTHGALTVTFDPNACLHSGVCLHALPRVFDITQKRWIQLEHEPANLVADVVSRCPSGALQYELADAPPAPEPSPATASPVLMELLTDGPVRVEGPIRITLESGEIVEKPGRVHLCRCGASQKKPFCDGSHKQTGFTSTVIPSTS